MALLETREPHEKGLNPNDSCTVAEQIMSSHAQVLAELTPENAESFGSGVQSVLCGKPPLVLCI